MTPSPTATYYMSMDTDDELIAALEASEDFVTVRDAGHLAWLLFQDEDRQDG